MNKRLMLLLTALLLSAAITSAGAWEPVPPCIEAPFDWSYSDDRQSIVIKRVQTGKVTYFVADVQLSNPDLFRTELDSGMAEVSTLASRAGAVLAINGDDYAAHKYGVIIRNGQLIRTHDTTRNLLIVDRNGDMRIKTDRRGEDYRALGNQLVQEGVLHTFEFGPELVRGGQAVPFSPDFDVISLNPSRLEPRTAIGQIGPLHYIIIVVDGRQEGYSEGISLQNLQQLFVAYGAGTAMNLDGGGSTELWFQGQSLNRPSGGKERRVSDIICF